MKGVYKIENINNGKKYIGSSKDIDKRFYQHRQELKNKTHHSTKLQHAWSKAKNKDVFLLDVVEVVDDISTLKEREQYYIDLFDTYHGGYNCSLKVDNPRYAKKNLDKKKKASIIPELQDEFNVLYTPGKFYFRGWRLHKLIDGLYSYSSYNFVLACMKWFLSTYPESSYKLQIGTRSNKYCMWGHYDNIDFATYDYIRGKIVLNIDGTNATLNQLKQENGYDEERHQVRSGTN